MLRNEEVSHVPHLAETEALQALRHWLARGWADRERVELGLDVLEALRLAYYPHAPLRPRIWSLRHAFTAYDATYVALAEALACHLVTADARLARAPGPTCPITVVRR